MHLKIQCNDENTFEMYKDHQITHKGDAGFDLYCVEDVTVMPGETVAINLGIKMSAHSSKIESVGSVAYWIVPRSSISKTPLRLANSGEWSA